MYSTLTFNHDELMNNILHITPFSQFFFVILKQISAITSFHTTYFYNKSLKYTFLKIATFLLPEDMHVEECTQFKQQQTKNSHPMQLF